jgi:hypothetical protein
MNRFLRETVKLFLGGDYNRSKIERTVDSIEIFGDNTNILVITNSNSKI